MNSKLLQDVNCLAGQMDFSVAKAAAFDRVHGD
jgi:hypothetical protein